MLRVAVPNKGALAVAAAEMLAEAGYRQRGEQRDLTVLDPVVPLCGSRQPDRQGQRCECEDHGQGHGDPVEVALDDGGAGRRRSDAAAEHVREPPAPPAVQENEQDQAERDGDVDGD